MGLIELFFGFKNRRRKKMVLLKVISGLDLLSMLVTGVITANKALVFNTTRVVINMKECGHLISVMGREPSGEWKTKSLDVSILAIGLKIRSMVVVHFSIRMVIDTTDTGLTECHKAKVV